MNLNDPQSLRRMHRQSTQAEIHAHQLRRLNTLLTDLLEHPFYRDRLINVTLPLDSLDEYFQSVPLLTKDEILNTTAGQPSPVFAGPRHRYVRYHQTSGSRGMPMPVWDTPEDWQWWVECWQYVLDAAEVTAEDTAMMAFSFGPFIGFWSANDALVARGSLVVPGGGLTSAARLKLMVDAQCTVLCCTPTYALHLASVAAEIGMELRSSRVKRIIVAGEPGGSVPQIRSAIESQWNARVVDHAGASELGAWGFASYQDNGLHVIESEFIPEFLVIDPWSGDVRVASEGERCELVMTNLGRKGGPLLRYRTGDVVMRQTRHDLPCHFAHLPGGILGRSDDMLVIRGVNVFPSGIEAIIRELQPTAEFRMVASSLDSMDQLEVEIEMETAQQSNAQRLEDHFRERLALRIPVTAVPPGSLPRSEGKSRRWVDRRS